MAIRENRNRRRFEKRERPDRKELGEHGEALTADFLVRGQGHELLTQHSPGDKPQGIDLETLTPEGRIQFTEVKTTEGRSTRPTMASTADGRQGSDGWLATRTGDSSQVRLDGPAHEQADSRAVHVDLAGDTITTWDVSADGQVATTPSEIYAASDFTQDDE